MLFASLFFSMPRKNTLLLTLTALVATQTVFAQGRSGATNSALGDFIRSNYTKYEYRIAMRDGTKLFTSVYVPKTPIRRYPILLQRTPYSVQPYGPAYLSGAHSAPPSFRPGRLHFRLSGRPRARPIRRRF